MFLQYGSKSSSSECVNTIATQVGMTMDHNKKMFCSALAFQEPPTCKTVTIVQDQLSLVALKISSKKGKASFKEKPASCKCSASVFPASNNRGSCSVAWSPL